MPTDPQKAAYIFSILRSDTKSRVLSKLTASEKTVLNRAVAEIKNITSSEKKTILQNFVKILEQNQIKRKKATVHALYLSLSLLAVMILVSTVYASVNSFSIGKTIQFIESIVMYGGSHIVLLPCVINLIKNENNSIIKMFQSKNSAIDAAVAGISALLIALLFLIFQPQPTVHSQSISSLFILLTAASVGPLVEELFFRYYLFFRNEPRYGFITTAFFSSLLFSLAHMPGTFALFVLYILSGLIFCALYYTRKNILTPFIAHACANFIILML